MVEITIIAAFAAGIISFLSPCVLPLIPAFLSYLSGSSLNGSAPSRARMFVNSVFFVLGFASVFALLGVLLNTLLASSSYQVQTWLSRIAGIIIMLFGLYVLGLIKVAFLERDYKINIKGKFSSSYPTSFVFGAAFAVGWSPCVGAVLGSIFALAIAEPSLSFILLLSYAVGLGIPFLLVGLFSSRAVELISKSRRFFKYFNIIVGIFLLALGVMVFTQTLNLVANFGFINYLLLR